MRNGEGQECCPQSSKADAQSTPKISQMLTPAQIKLLEFANYLDAPDMVESLKLLHDITIYHSSEPIDEAEKDALFSIKGLWECIERIKG